METLVFVDSLGDFDQKGSYWLGIDLERYFKEVNFWCKMGFYTNFSQKEEIYLFEPLLSLLEEF